MSFKVNGATVNDVIVNDTYGANEVISNGELVHKRDDSVGDVRAISATYGGEIQAVVKYRQDITTVKNRAMTFGEGINPTYASVGTDIAGSVDFVYMDPLDNTQLSIRRYNAYGLLRVKTDVTLSAAPTRQVAIARGGDQFSSSRRLLVSLENAEVDPVLAVYPMTINDRAITVGERIVLDFPSNRNTQGGAIVPLDRLVDITDDDSRLVVAYRNYVKAWDINWADSPVSFTTVGGVIRNGSGDISGDNGKILRVKAGYSDDLVVCCEAINVTGHTCFDIYDMSNNFTRVLSMPYDLAITDVSWDSHYYHVVGYNQWDTPILRSIPVSHVDYTGADIVIGSGEIDHSFIYFEVGSPNNLVEPKSLLASHVRGGGGPNVPVFLVTAHKGALGLFATKFPDHRYWYGGAMSQADYTDDHDNPAFLHVSGLGFDYGIEGMATRGYYGTLGEDPNLTLQTEIGIREGMYGNISLGNPSTGKYRITRLTKITNDIGTSSSRAGIDIEFDSTDFNGAIGLYIHNETKGTKSWWPLSKFELVPGGNLKYQFTFNPFGGTNYGITSTVLAEVGDDVDIELVYQDSNNYPNITDLVVGERTGVEWYVTFVGDLSGNVYGFMERGLYNRYKNPESLEGMGSAVRSGFYRRQTLAFVTDESIDPDTGVKSYTTHLVIEGGMDNEFRSVTCNGVTLNVTDASIRGNGGGYSIDTATPVVEDRRVVTYTWNQKVFDATDVGVSYTVDFVRN